MSATRGPIWSALEYGCHVRDVFVLFEERLRLMLTQDDPTFANWDAAVASGDVFRSISQRVSLVEVRVYIHA